MHFTRQQDKRPVPDHQNGTAVLSADDSRHAVRVLRLQRGQEAEIIAGGRRYRAVLADAFDQFLKGDPAYADSWFLMQMMESVRTLEEDPAFRDTGDQDAGRSVPPHPHG